MLPFVSGRLVGGMIVGSVFVVFGVLVSIGECHVSMTFPPARSFSLDFLNTFWSKQPCGMPKGRTKTTLLGGSQFNATWHLGYAHGGGYRLELLDRNENYLADLTPDEGGGFYRGRMTAQWHLVDLPRNLTCHDCTIRLLRQVPEFSPNFQFLSCSDVDIVSKYNFVETCSGKGYYSGGKCNCYSRFWGEKCQYEDECDTDADCNFRGRCIYLGGSALPRKQCFCSPTHFGTHCSRSNPPGMATGPSSLDLRKHVRAKLSDKMTLLFRFLLGRTSHQDEIEFVVQMNGTSFAGLGWRPSNIGPICKSWPFYPDALLPSVNAAVGHRISKRSSSFTITKSLDHSEAHDDHGHLISAHQNDDAIFYRTLPKTSNVLSNKLVTATDVRQAQENRFVQARVQIHPSHQQSIRQSSSIRRANRITPTTTRRTTTPKPPPPPVHHSASEQQDSPTFVPAEYADQDAFTPMDCSDIVMGAARGFYHRIRDAYARGRHTPKVDAEWGGRDDLTGASGWETNGVTTLVFRRRLISTDGPDHSIDGEMQVIWAKGQMPGEYVSDANHRLERENPVVSDFYTLDEYKYHGLGPQRGLLYIDFSTVRNEYAKGTFN